MAKEKMVEAKSLIQQKRYNEARAILRSVNHPTAMKWLAKLDDIAPEADDDLPPLEDDLPETTKRYTLYKWVKAFVVTVIVLAIGFAVYTQTIGRSDPNRSKAYVRLFSYCLDVYNEVGNRSGKDNCNEWQKEAFDRYNDKIMACQLQSPDLDKPFNDCLTDEDILPPGIVRNR